MAEVEFRQVSKRFADRSVIDAVDIIIPDGVLCVFVGPSGCGKSTLLRMLAGLVEPTSGTISIGGKTVNGLPPRDRDIAMVFQSYALYPHMTVAENIGFPLRMNGIGAASRHIRVVEVAELLGLGNELDRYPRHLSGGQRQRVAMGRAIVRDPAVFLFDEPLSNLDASLRVLMRIEIAQLHRRLGSTMIFVTHDQIEAMTLADRIVVINAGRIEQQGDPMTLYEHPANLFVAGFIGTPAMNFLPARVATDGSVRLIAGGAELQMPHVPSVPPGNVTLGVRPEHLSIAAAGKGRLSGEVELVERLGVETIVVVRVPALATQLSIRVPPSTAIKPGMPIGIEIDTTRVHVFDTQGCAC